MYTEAIKTYYRAYFPNCTFNEDSYGDVAVRTDNSRGVNWYIGIFGDRDNPDDDFVMYSGEIFKSYDGLSRLLKMLKSETERQNW